MIPESVSSHVSGGKFASSASSSSSRSPSILSDRGSVGGSLRRLAFETGDRKQPPDSATPVAKLAKKFDADSVFGASATLTRFGEGFVSFVALVVVCACDIACDYVVLCAACLCLF